MFISKGKDDELWTGREGWQTSVSVQGYHGRSVGLICSTVASRNLISFRLPLVLVLASESWIVIR